LTILSPEAGDSGQFAKKKIVWPLKRSKEIARSVKSELIMYRAILREEGKPTSAKLFLGLARTQTTLGKTIRLLWNPEQDYQKTRRAGTKERWKLIQSRITGTSSLPSDWTPIGR